MTSRIHAHLPLGSMTTGTYSLMLYFHASAFDLHASQTGSIYLSFE